MAWLPGYRVLSSSTHALLARGITESRVHCVVWNGNRGKRSTAALSKPPGGAKRKARRKKMSLTVRKHFIRTTGYIHLLFGAGSCFGSLKTSREEGLQCAVYSLFCATTTVHTDGLFSAAYLHKGYLYMYVCAMDAAGARDLVR